MNKLLALACGVLFGLGLGVSGMLDPAKVLGFLDLSDHWDPTLAFVMGGAVLVTLQWPVIGFVAAMIAGQWLAHMLQSVRWSRLGKTISHSGG
jgi:hypothetical protein